ncbi:heat shock transcription factor, Y-linked-like [Ochotona princeps]|uniref:heat shock transcription factor, Y-linked-like n=1 Tax=Ochotona princeps TaxID=9978 RepID=UPI00271526CF|nr:heat shock transcription factor, Y-linked-like [Ochotona princeps]
MCCERQSLSPDILMETPERHQLFLEDTHLRSVIEEEAFKLLSQHSLLDRLSSPSDGFSHQEQNNQHVLGFPRKLWQIVESPEFKSIWWGEGGTCIVIDVERFQTEVLEMKGHFRIFETCNMKSFVRQLNLYGFRKMQSTFQRSASLFHFMPECHDVLGTSKLHFFHHPHFKQGCPQLLRHVLRRVSIKKKYQPLESSPQNQPNESPRAQEVLAKNNGNASVVPRNSTSLGNYACFGASSRRCSPPVAENVAREPGAIRGALSAPPSSSAIRAVIKDTLTLAISPQLTPKPQKDATLHSSLPNDAAAIRIPPHIPGILVPSTIISSPIPGRQSTHPHENDATAIFCLPSYSFPK